MSAASPAFTSEAEMVFMPPVPPLTVTPVPIEPPSDSSWLLPAPKLIEAPEVRAASRYTTSLPEPPVIVAPAALSVKVTPPLLVEASTDVSAPNVEFDSMTTEPVPEMVSDVTAPVSR